MKLLERLQKGVKGVRERVLGKVEYNKLKGYKGKGLGEREVSEKN